MNAQGLSEKQNFSKGKKNSPTNQVTILRTIEIFLKPTTEHNDRLTGTVILNGTNQTHLQLNIGSSMRKESEPLSLCTQVAVIFLYFLETPVITHWFQQCCLTVL